MIGCEGLGGAVTQEEKRNEAIAAELAKGQRHMLDPLMHLLMDNFDSESDLTHGYSSLLTLQSAGLPFRVHCNVSRSMWGRCRVESFGARCAGQKVVLLSAAPSGWPPACSLGGGKTRGP
jgi:hypothetical protein